MPAAASDVPAPRAPVCQPSDRFWIGLTLLLFAAGAALRVHNAQALFLGHGFDEIFNQAYIRELLTDWSLPHPEDHWSAARPPLFFYLSGLVARAFGPAQVASVHAIRLASSAFGLIAIALGVWQLWRATAGDARRVALAAGLLLFLPAHVYLSAMVNEEVSVASWITLALILAMDERSSPSLDSSESSDWSSWLRLVAIGVAGGFAFLTKLTGCLVVVAVALTFALDGWRTGRLRAGLARAAVVSGVALIVGGWFYARSFALYGYLYPHSLDAHSIMQSIPPGSRSLVDYLQLSFSAFSDTRVNSPGLLHSVWGGTYVTWWFDGQRGFLPRSDPTVDRMGQAILVLGLLPTAAAVAGCARGARRAWRDSAAVDTPMLVLSALMLAGYLLYTWQNPWFVCVKASYLLGLGLPYAWWASDRLVAWTRGSRLLAAVVWLDLVLLVAAIAAAFSFGTPLWEMTLGVDLPGLPWLDEQR